MLDDIDAPIEDTTVLELRDVWPAGIEEEEEVEENGADRRIPPRRSSGGAALVAARRDLLVPEGLGVGRGSRRLSEGLLMIGSLWRKSLGKSQNL